MNLWRIYPVAAPGDPRWQGRQRWHEVIVRAANPAFARIIASRLESRAPRFSQGNESRALRSGFLDEKLYWVSRLSNEEAAAFAPGNTADIVAARLHEESALEPAYASRTADTAGEAAAS